MSATSCYGFVFVISARAPDSRTLLVAYYAATVLFLLLDYGLGINVRLAFLEPLPGLRAAYYAILGMCFALIVWRPAWTVLVGTFESLVTLIALIFSMAMRALIVTDRMLETSTGLITMPEILNFLISGSAAYIAWVRGISELRRRPPWF